MSTKFDKFKEYLHDNPQFGFIVCLLALILVVYILQSVSSSMSLPKQASYTRDIYEDVANNVKTGDFTETERGTVNKMVKSFADYFTYFNKSSSENITAQLAPIMMLMPVLLPLSIGAILLFLIGYIIWFMWNYWDIVAEAYLRAIATVATYVYKVVVCKIKHETAGWGIPFNLGTLDAGIATVNLNFGTLRIFPTSWAQDQCPDFVSMSMDWYNTYIKTPFGPKRDALGQSLNTKLTKVYDTIVTKPIRLLSTLGTQ